MATRQRPGVGARRGLREVSVRSGDPTEACDLGTRIYHEHRLSVLGDTDAFSMTIEAAALGPLTIGWLSYDTPVRIETPEFVESYQVNILAGGHMLAICGPEEIHATPDLAMVYRPDRPTGFTGWSTPEPMLALKISRAALEHELEQLLDRPVKRPVPFALAFDVAQRHGADWSRLVQMIASGLADDDSLLRRPIVAAP